MKKFINNLNILVVVLVSTLFLVACNDDDNFKYDLPEQEAVSNVDVNFMQSAQSQCFADLSITSDADNTSVYYLIMAASASAPSSVDVFNNGDVLMFDTAGTQEITTSQLTLGVEYMLYSISVNNDGLRSETVFSQNYTHVSNYQINIDTSYSGDSYIGSSNLSTNTITLTPTTNPNEYLVDSCWGANFVADATGDPGYAGAFVYSGTLIINSDLTITIVGNDGWTLGGEGVYDPCTNAISYTLGQALFQNPFTVDVYLTPENL